MLTLTLLFPFLSPRASCNVADAVQMLSSISCLVCSSHFLCLYMLEIARSVSQSVSFVLAFNLGQGIKCSLHECHLSRLFWLSDFGAVVLGGLSLKGYDPHKIMDRNLQALVFSSAVSRFQHCAIEKYQMAILLWQPHIPFFLADMPPQFARWQVWVRPQILVRRIGPTPLLLQSLSLLSFLAHAYFKLPAIFSRRVNIFRISQMGPLLYAFFLLSALLSAPRRQIG